MSTSKSGGSGRGQQGAYNWRHRHGPDTVARLEEIFKECTHPDETRRREIGGELGLDPQQVKFWFQNKKTQVRTRNERLDTNALRVENERIKSENRIMRETLKNACCGPCGGRAMQPEEGELYLQVLRVENLLLAKECERIASLLGNDGISPVQLRGLPSSSHDTSRENLLNQTVGIPAQNQIISNHDHHIPAPTPTVTQSQNIPIISPGHNQDIPAPALDQHIPTTPVIDQDNPALNQDDAPMISCLNTNVAALVTALDQNIPSLIPTHDQNSNIPTAEKEIQAFNISNNNITALGRDISAPNQDHGPSDLDQELDAILKILNTDMPPQPMMNPSKNMENALMSKIANNAMEELTKLLSLNEPFWFRSLLDGKFVLQRDCYQRIFGRRSNSLSGPHARIESSKDSRVVKMRGAQLVEMFLNSDKWVDLFPTIVRRAQTIRVLESGSSGNRNGVLQLMNAEIHVLSHLVPIREFLFLRYCKQIEEGVWAIGDVSIDSSTYKITSPLARKLPSGCLIQEMTNGFCRVSWVEHVEVDDKIQTHQLFRDVVCGNNAYGAETWVMMLERMCERFASASAETIPSVEAGGVIKSSGGRRNIMDLTHRMVKNFWGNLAMQDNTNFPHLTRMDNGGIRLSVRMNNTAPGVPKGMIISAATSFQIPLSPLDVFNYLINNKERPKWEVLCNGSVAHEIQHISTGSNPGNCISIMRPFVPTENNMVILQESYVDALGSMLVYAPFDMEALNLVMKGEDPSLFPILPSGLTISWDGRADVGQYGQVGKSGGSLVTLMLQLLACSPSRMRMVDIEFVGSVNTLVTSTVEKIKDALNCSNLK